MGVIGTGAGGGLSAKDKQEVKNWMAKGHSVLNGKVLGEYEPVLVQQDTRAEHSGGQDTWMSMTSRPLPAGRYLFSAVAYGTDLGITASINIAGTGVGKSVGGYNPTKSYFGIMDVPDGSTVSIYCRAESMPQGVKANAVGAAYSIWRL